MTMYVLKDPPQRLSRGAVHGKVYVTFVELQLGTFLWRRATAEEEEEVGACPSASVCGGDDTLFIKKMDGWMAGRLQTDDM